MFNLNLPITLIGLLLPALSSCSHLGGTPFSLTMENSEAKSYREHCEMYKTYYQCMEKALNKATPRIKVNNIPDDLEELMEIHREFAEDLLDYIHDLKTDCQTTVME